MADVLVKAEGISKKFSKSLKRSMLYGMQDIAQTMLGMSPKTDKLRTGEFWAVDDVSFELKRGECLGLIGKNGSGKSTLLKILNGIISPDKGRVEIKGKIGALIEVGAGFHPMLTGRENIYINGSILGFTKKEIDKKFDEIVDFAELVEFLDTPVKHYSSGMRVRLGFAIAAQMEPDIMLIDEVLAVGDIGFRAKCFNAVYNILQKAAVIFVSHSMPQVSRICSDIMVMNCGKSRFQGKDLAKGIEIFYSYFQSEESIVIGGERAKILDVDLECNGTMGANKINYLDELIVHLRLLVDSEFTNPNIIVSILSQNQQIITQCSSYYDGVEIFNSGEEIYVSVNMGKMNFNPGIYFLEVAITAERHGNLLVKHQAVKKFRILGNNIGLAPLLIEGEWNLNISSSRIIQS